jgi:hypothetical protein
MLENNGCPSRQDVVSVGGTWELLDRKIDPVTKATGTFAVK